MSGASTTRLIKISLYILNVIIFLSGLIMLIVGSVAQSSINTQKLATSINGYSTQTGKLLIVYLFFIPKAC